MPHTPSGQPPMNLLVNPWIPVLTADGQQRRVGLIDLFSGSDQHQLDMPEPTQYLPFVQLCTALVCHAYKISDDWLDEDPALIRSAVVDPGTAQDAWVAPVLDYLDARAGDFTSETFLQSPLPVAVDEGQLARLSPIISAEGFGRDLTEPMELIEALRWLPASAALGAGRVKQLDDESAGGRNSYASLGSRAVTGLIAVAPTLRATIAANSAQMLFEVDAELDKPGTELGDRHPDDDWRPAGPIGHLTAPQALLRLVLDDEGMVTGVASGPTYPEAVKDADGNKVELDRPSAGERAVLWDPFAVLIPDKEAGGYSGAVSALAGRASAGALFTDPVELMPLIIDISTGSLRHRGLVSYLGDNPGQWIDIMGLTVGYVQGNTKVNKICAATISVETSSLADPRRREVIAHVLTLSGCAQQALTSGVFALMRAISGPSANPRKTSTLTSLTPQRAAATVIAELRVVVADRVAAVMAASTEQKVLAGHQQYLDDLRRVSLAGLHDVADSQGPAAWTFADEGYTPIQRGEYALLKKLREGGIVDE